MAAFEFNNENRVISPTDTNSCYDSRRLREECIVAFKVYDSARSQDCLTGNDMGPARAAECKTIGDERYNDGDVIVPPSNAAAVTIDRLKIKKIIIVDKEPNAFKNGYWDVDLKFVFEYRLTFREADGRVLGSIRANCIYNKRTTLFGSIGSDLVIATDLFAKPEGSVTLDADPFIIVEAKAVALDAEIRYAFRNDRVCGPGEDLSPEPSSVNVTIGLFSIIKLIRIVDLTVESRGFCIPEESAVSPTNPCDFFDSLDFPMDVFAPPQKPEFFAGIVNNIPRNQRNRGVCEPCLDFEDSTDK